MIYLTVIDIIALFQTQSIIVNSTRTSNAFIIR